MKKILRELYRIWSQVVTIALGSWIAFKPPKVGSKQVLDMLDIIEPGDIILRKYKYQTSSFILPGDYTHSGVVKDHTTMVHITGTGCDYIHPLDFMMHSDKFAILRPHWKSPQDLKDAIAQADKFVADHVKYDFFFGEDSTRLYCHELCAKFLEAGNIKVKLSKVRMFLFITMHAYLPENLEETSDIKYKFE
jgi:hypothetical protein